MPAHQFPQPRLRLQRPAPGGTFMGLLAGLLLGLLVALGVALYVAKVPVPFVDKLPQRTADQDAAETERNKNWDPNAPLAGKHPLPKGPAAASAPAGTASAAAGTSPGAAVASGKDNKPADSKSEVTGLFIQAGAFGRAEDAEQQRARLAMLGFSARLSEREQNGKPVYRVRLGPYETRDDSQGPMDRLQAAGIDVTLVRVERSAQP